MNLLTVEYDKRKQCVVRRSSVLKEERAVSCPHSITLNLLKFHIFLRNDVHSASVQIMYVVCDNAD